MQRLVSPTALAWLIGRTQTNGKADYASVHRFQDGLALTPLSAWGSDYAPPAQVLVQAGVDTAPPAEQVAVMDGATFFRRLAELLVTNPPADADAPAIERFAAIGLAPGTFDPDPELADAIGQGARIGMEKIQAATKTSGSPTATGWTILRGLGSYRTDYGKRAVVARGGLGANLDKDAIYPHATTDGDGQPLDGASRYVVHFGPGQTPPANAFWSLTMYNDRQAFVANPIGVRDR